LKTNVQDYQIVIKIIKAWKPTNLLY